jgi:hypothetical protein
MVAFIDGVFLKSAKETEFHTSEGFQFKQWEFDEIETMLYEKAKDIVRFKFEGDVGTILPTGKITGLCYTGFYCKYFQVCHALDDVVKKHVINNNFTNRPFDPLNYDGE